MYFLSTLINKYFAGVTSHELFTNIFEVSTISHPFLHMRKWRHKKPSYFPRTTVSNTTTLSILTWKQQQQLQQQQQIFAEKNSGCEILSGMISFFIFKNPIIIFKNQFVRVQEILSLNSDWNCIEFKI